MDTSVITTTPYIPSTTEKKRAIACFLFLGILMSLASQKEFSPFEYYYLGTSIGWWMFGVIVVGTLLLTLVLPFFLLLSFPLFLAWVIIGGILVWQAWSGVMSNSVGLFRFLAGIGTWMLSLFEVQVAQQLSAPVASPLEQPTTPSSVS